MNMNTGFSFITIVDDVPPSVLYCPGDITKLVNDPMETPTIRWNEPVVEDNSGILSGADQTQVSGTEFPIGETEVVYDFKDESENVAECRFQVSIQYIGVYTHGKNKIMLERILQAITKIHK